MQNWVTGEGENGGGKRDGTVSGMEGKGKRAAGGGGQKEKGRELGTGPPIG